MNTIASLPLPDIVPSFRKPGTKDWECMQLPSAEANVEKTEEKKSRNKVDHANEVLKNTLLQSLQMQHLVVLAGSGCSYHLGGPKMPDLWNIVVGKAPSKEAKHVATIVNYKLEESNIEHLLSRVEAFLSLQENKIVRDYLTTAQMGILQKCTEFLKEDKLDAHRTFLHRLSRRRTRDQRLRIFTTNYDLCFERAAAKIGCVAIDGFSFMTPRQYDPSYFDYDIIRRSRSGDNSGNYLEGVFILYKLHGSVNWEATGNGIIERERPDPQKACLVYPARGKYQKSFDQPFIESISQYLASIREPNTCLLVVGSGFNDNHLSGPLLSAVRSNPHLRLMVVDPYAKEKANKTTNNYLRALFDESENGGDVWFINDTFEGFSNRLPNLKSLTPAERLFKDIKGAIQHNEHFGY